MTKPLSRTQKAPIWKTLQWIKTLLQAFPVFKTVDFSEQMEVGNQFGMLFSIALSIYFVILEIVSYSDFITHAITFFPRFSKVKDIIVSL